ncbi:WbqC family protein [Pectobacterium brasiliense]|uniref:WbqC family protein n=1 Tax=Pectobacterium brasiliense TaxID=180957 RepID=UPI001CE225B0|nr:WbqC family protein [Pectobacterium brasiliense]MCA5920335.1 WbqC family protein [Pectobacterium brasiliense]MCA5926475.1 WbqC family protein [Pectobacterium brasiliense]MCA5936357.1 WbqC family protein [Pectobacterium brasiliense]MCA5940265.1 WbqC family protein [Pectobacterium brasiliense]MCA5945113.1 WbqC family protein [Pectobacterium brasiliense]
MKVGIMQPYFFPYLGYISLVKHTDRFIFLDDVQFIRHGWIERNRILKPAGDWQYISVPLNKKTFTTKIKNVEINNNSDWKGKIIRQLEHYKKRAPFYKDTIAVVDDALSIETNSIVELNSHALKSVCSYLNIKTDISIFSNLDMEIETPNEPDDWAVNICKEIKGVTQYWNPIGGMSFFNKEKYHDAGIELIFHNVNLLPYNQLNRLADFEAGLSIIDSMMFNSPDELNKMLDNYECL